METRSIHDLKITLPGDEPECLDLCDGVPRDGTSVTEELVSGEVWSRAHLTNVKVGRSWIVNADLGSTVFASVMFERCVFKGCSLVGSRWEGVALKNVIFENCRLDYAIVNDVKTAGPVGFVGCSLTETVLNGGSLSPAALDNCKLSGLAIEGCDLRGVDLRSNDITGLGAATALRGTILSPSQLPALADLLVQEISIKIGSEPA